MSISGPIGQSAGWPRASPEQPDLLNPDLEAAKARPAATLQALPGRTATRQRQTDPVPGSQRTRGAADARARANRSQPVIVVAWSAPGTHGTGNPWSAPGTSGHGRRKRTAGHRAFTALASDGQAA